MKAIRKYPKNWAMLLKAMMIFTPTEVGHNGIQTSELPHKTDHPCDWQDY
jgi:hypothetical protein